MTTETDNPTDNPTRTETIRVTIWHDYDVESPNEYGLFRLGSFNTRHVSSVDPDRVLACRFEWPDPEDPDYPFTCEDPPHSRDPGEWDEWPAHDYQPDPDIIAFLSYFEHGLCRWSRANIDPAKGWDPGGWDTVRFAGVLLWNGDDDERGWWANLPDDDLNAEIDKTRIIDGFLNEYTDWANGATYGFTVDAVTQCECCGQSVDTLVDSCGGFIGGLVADDGSDGYVVDEYRAVIAYYLDVEPDELEQGKDYTVTERF